MKKNFLVIMLFLMSSASFIKGQPGPKEKGLEAITLDAIRGQLEFLASDWTEGRSTGDKGYYLASEYVASMLKVFGATGAGDAEYGGRYGRRMFAMPSIAGGPGRPILTPSKSYFQNFTLIETLPGGTSSMAVTKSSVEYVFEEGIDYSIGRNAASTKFVAPVVFVGYGLVDKEKGIDDFAGIDVKGKVILRLSGIPGGNDGNSPMYIKLAGDNPRNLFQYMRRKDDALAGRGILGVIDIYDVTLSADVAKSWGVYKFDNNMSPAESRSRGSRIDLKLDDNQIIASPVSLTVSQKVMNLLLKDSGLDLPKFEKDAAAGINKLKPFTLPGVTISMNVSVKSRRVNVRNVVAMIEGENPDEFVVVGAHLDHMGMNNGMIWNGADDNASGVVGVVTLAKAFVASGIKPKRSILFCAWTGEEQGLLGSEYFTHYPTVGKISGIKFYLNFDMIARDTVNDTEKNMARITYTSAFPKLEEITKTNLENYNLNLDLTILKANEPSGGSDFESFSNYKIPIIEWFTMYNPEYHQPSDQVELINWDKMLNIIKLGYLQLWDIVNGDIK
jgi:hypothetical protein